MKKIRLIIGAAIAAAALCNVNIAATGEDDAEMIVQNAVALSNAEDDSGFCYEAGSIIRPNGGHKVRMVINR